MSVNCGHKGIPAPRRCDWPPNISEIVADTATGTAVRHIPPGELRDEILVLLRLGVKFKAQQVGKRPGFLARLVLDCARRAGPPYSFKQLLDELELEAARRELNGEKASPVEKIDRVWQLITIHAPKRAQIPFGTIRNHLTHAKKTLQAEIHGSA